VKGESVIPRKYFVVSGKGLSEVSMLNAYDRALLDAGIGNYNLVPVSSIIPPGAEEIEPIKLPPGSIVFVVIAKAEGREGTVSAGMAWYSGESEECGFVVEAHGNTDIGEIGRRLKSMIEEMGKARGINVEAVKMRIETLDIPKGLYGCVIVALVMVV